MVKHKVRLKRCLSLFELILYGVGLILGAGIYVLLGSVAGMAGNLVWLSFAIAAIVAAFTAMSYAELSSMFPESGAEFVYAKHAFGSDALAWIIGFIALVAIVTGVGTVAIGFAKYFSFFFPFDLILISLGLIAVLSFINFWGIKESSTINIISTLIEGSGLLIIILFGLYFLFTGSISLPNLLDFPATGIEWVFPVSSAAALIFFAYLGFEDLAKLSEEAENPKKNLPKAFMYSLIISTVLYILVAVIAISVVPFAELGKADQPLALVAKEMIGSISPEILAVIALFATVNTVLAMLVAGSRMLYGMAEENSMPAIFEKINSEHKTPWIAIIAVMLASILFLAFGKIEILASMTDAGIFILFFFVNLSVIMLRLKQPKLHRAWKMPFNIAGIPLFAVLGCISCIALLGSLTHPVNLFGYEMPALIASMIIFSTAIPAYFLFGKRNVKLTRNKK